ncbi:hypothetical protein [Rhizobium sp. BK176]|uniref:hypothetical protein n=1 Tax=Rhizobium sp. BK176 TaxID=2587071 RepID=UPI00216785CD|nr:hypothetical protein [Rhizobium sp. BK176]MCS4088617.1 hypothetical protein [Rhizobium sp. BK176]
MSPRLTVRRLEAIVEALTARTAGDLDIEDEGAPTRDDYEAALDWALAEIGSRKTKSARPVVSR